MILQNEIAIVTGGSRGIGRAIVERFVAEGAYVLTCAEDARAGVTVAREINSRFDGQQRVEFVHADMAEAGVAEMLVGRALKAFGKPTIVVNNAATVIMKDTSLASATDLDYTLKVNVLAYWSLARAAYESMREMGSGAIVHVASTHPIQTRPNCFPYNMSKGAVLAMTRAMAVDFGTAGVRVNSLLPGIVETKPTQEWLKSEPDSEARRNQLIGDNSLPRFPTVDEVASAALFLASPMSAAISGVDLIVDCGRQAKRA